MELLSSLRSHRSNRNQDLIFWDQDQACLTAMIEDDQKLSLEEMLQNMLNTIGTLDFAGTYCFD